MIDDWIWDKKNLANNNIFNILWIGSGMVALIVGSKHLAFFGNNWKGFFIAMIGFFMIMLQHHWLNEKINYYKEKAK